MAEGVAVPRGRGAPLVTVVVPTRDRWALLEATLTSVLAQEGVELDVIVVDDGSIRPMPREGAPWNDPRVRNARHERSRGVAAARNVGIAEAHGDWVAFLDDDDLWSPHKLSAQIRAARDVGAAFAYGGAALFSSAGHPIHVREAPPPRALRSLLSSHNAIPAGASNVIASREVLRDLGGFDVNLRHLADWDLWIRLAERAPAARCPGTHVGYRIHATSMRSSTGGVLRELRYLDGKHDLTPSVDRVWVYRWLAEGLLLAGKHGRASFIYALGAARCSSAGDLKTAGRALGARARPRHRTRSAPGSGSNPRPDGPVPWLEQGLAGEDDRASRLPSPATGGARTAITSWIRRLAAALLTRVLEVTSLKAGIALVYHEIGEVGRPSPEAEIVPVVDELLLHEQLDHLRAHYHPVAARSLRLEATARRRGQRFPVALTFDDDLRSHLDVSAPMLGVAGVPATFFLTGASLDGPRSFWWERLQRAIDARLVSSAPDTVSDMAAAVEDLAPPEREEVAASLLAKLGGELPESGLRARHVGQLAASGFDIGFHTVRHEKLPALPDSELERALVDGRGKLEAAASGPIGLIAYPHGAADRRVAAAAHAAGYEAGFTTAGSVLSQGTDPFLIGRLYPTGSSVGHFALQIARALLRETLAAKTSDRA